MDLGLYKKILAAFLVGVVLGGLGVIVYRYIEERADRPLSIGENYIEKAGEQWSRYRNTNLGLSFEYRRSPRGYRLVELPEDARMLLLVKAEDYDLIENPPEGGEGPVAITVEARENLEALPALTWVQTNVRSNFNLGNKQSESVPVGGETGIRYSWSGLYEADSVAVAQGNTLYLFTVTYIDADDPMRDDFNDLLGSVTFE